MIAVGVCGSSLANLISGFAASLAELAFLKLFAVTFEVLVVGVVTALIVEEAPVEHRGTAVSLIALLSGRASSTAAAPYRLLPRTWRWRFYPTGAGSWLAPLFGGFLPRTRTRRGCPGPG